jgi:hypothetical protein
VHPQTLHQQPMLLLQQAWLVLASAGHLQQALLLVLHHQQQHMTLVAPQPRCLTRCLLSRLRQALPQMELQLQQLLLLTVPVWHHLLLQHHLMHQQHRGMEVVSQACSTLQQQWQLHPRHCEQACHGCRLSCCCCCCCCCRRRRTPTQ